MRATWEWLVRRGVDSSVPPDETRYIVTTNMAAMLGGLLAVPYSVVALAMGLHVSVFLTFAVSGLGYLLTLWINHRGHRTLAPIWLQFCVIAATCVCHLLYGKAGFHFYLIAVVAAAPVMHRPGRPAAPASMMISATILFVAAVVLSTGQTALFDIGDERLWEVGNLLGVFGCITITAAYAHVIARRAEVELNGAQARLVEAEKTAAVAQLVSGILHEVNTPLGAIRSSCDSMQKAMERASGLFDEDGELARDEKRALRGLHMAPSLGNTVDDAVGRISSMVEGLERFVNLDGAEEAEIDVRVSLEDAVTILGHPVERECDDDLPGVLCSPGRLNHVLLELLKNAVDAVDEGGEVRASACLRDSEVVVEVADDGRGISEVELARIFDIGFSRKGPRVAMRLGLPTAKRHVEEMGGQLKIESAAGVGTTVRVSFPVAKSA